MRANYPDPASTALFARSARLLEQSLTIQNGATAASRRLEWLLKLKIPFALPRADASADADARKSR
jgi:hypothetical protein